MVRSWGVIALVLQQELGGDEGDAQCPGEVPPLSSATDHSDDGKTQGRRRVVLPLGSGGHGLCRAPPHWGVYH